MASFVWGIVLAVCLLSGLAPAHAQEPQPRREQQEQYVPIDQLPPQEQLASAPLLIGAYAFVMTALFVYVLSLSRRMTTVQREVERLESDMRRSGRG
jgi:CcmD family protein